MAGTERQSIVVTSDTVVAVASRPIRTDGNPLAFQVINAPAAFVALEGSLDGTNWVDLNYANLPGAGFIMTVMNTLGAGYYAVYERPEFVRMVVAIDAGGPRNYYAVLLTKKKPD